MTDPILVQRLAHLLEGMSEATPKGEGFWPAVAAFAANEIARTVVKTTQPLPAEPFVALVKARETLAIVARDATLAGLADQVTAALDRRGEGTVWLVQVRQIVEVTG
jgi:hypothetical protein